MCNFSKGIYNDGFEEGIKQGIKQGIEQETIRSVLNLMKSLQINIEKAMVLLELDENMKTICRENITC